MSGAKGSSGERRIPPQNIEAEQSVLGACLLSTQAQVDVLALLTPNDFVKPSHQHIYDAIRSLYRLDKPIDAVTVGDELTRAGLFDEIGGMSTLLELQHATPSISTAGHYAEIVLRTSQRRALIYAATQIAEAGYADDGTGVGEIVQDAKTKLDTVEMMGGVSVEYTSGSQFMGNPPAPSDWIMPHILERDDRMLVTGGEGSGKSMALLQWAIMTACGCHWWALSKVTPRRVLFLDLEIGEKRSRRRAEVFKRAADNFMPGWEANLVVRSKSEDVDVATRAGSSWVASLVEASGCELLVLGPIYRLTSGVTRPGDIGGEDAAKRSAFALDKIRERYGCAVIAETHAAKGESGRGRDLRPFGSSVWTRWPEFGCGLLAQAPNAVGYHPDNREWQMWRPGRDPRDWPDFFEVSNVPGKWRMQAVFETIPGWYLRMQNGTGTQY